MADGFDRAEAELIDLGIEMITIPDRLRIVRPEWVEALAISIRESGLLAPIAVARDPQSNGFILVDGEHRLEAFKSLGRDTIPALVREETEAERQRHEIYANLIRNELNALDRALFIERLVSIFEAENPDFAHGGDRKSLKKQRKNQVANIATWSTLANEAAKRTGLGVRSLRYGRDLARSLAPEARDLLRLSDLADNQAQLFKLASMPAEEQIAVARAIVEGKARAPKQARLALGLDAMIAVEPGEKLFVAFLGIWARMDAATKRRVVAYVTDSARKKRGKAGEAPEPDAVA